MSIKIVIDGVFFQLAKSGIARVWHAALVELLHRQDIEIFLLDRGMCPTLPKVNKLQFPDYAFRSTTADSELIELMCKNVSADLFISTYYTTPLETPSIALVHDMIPERFGFDLGARAWQEKEMCISHAQRHLCVSNQTKMDLLEFYPELDSENVRVAYNGVDHEIFKPKSALSIDILLAEVGIKQPYFIIVGSRSQHRGYKNIELFFKAIDVLPSFRCDVLLVGGEAEIQDWATAAILKGCNVKRADLSDEQLAAAYSGATALVYPSLYEGFGLPVVEAMACGCPVITTTRGSLAEIASNSAQVIDGTSVHEMADAIQTIQDPMTANRLRDAGLEHAGMFRWNKFSNTLLELAKLTVDESRQGKFKQFYRDWRKLRAIQGDVDLLTHISNAT